MVRPTIKVYIPTDETPRQEFDSLNTMGKKHSERFAKLREFIKEHSYSPRMDGPADIQPDKYQSVN
jgi:hypothetical protein